MDASVVLRPPRRDDVADVVALKRACDAVEFGRPDTDDADVLADWDGTGFALDRDARVAVDRAAGERIVGYSHAFELYVEIVVHPDCNGRGIGTALREFAERRALEQADQGVEVKIWQAPRRTNGTAHRLLEAAGYTRGHHYVEMEVELDGEAPEPVWPAGVTVRTFELGRDEQACHALQNLAWSQYKTYEPTTFERWTDLTREPDFDPSLWFLADEGDDLVGMCLCREYEDQSWITSLGVHPEHRGRGLGEALLRHAFAHLRVRGNVRAGLSVSSRNMQSAWRLYERVGMHDAGGWVAFEKVLREAGPA
jgi:mycothiol synthase